MTSKLLLSFCVFVALVVVAQASVHHYRIPANPADGQSVVYETLPPRTREGHDTVVHDDGGRKHGGGSIFDVLAKGVNAVLG